MVSDVDTTHSNTDNTGGTRDKPRKKHTRSQHKNSSLFGPITNSVLDQIIKEVKKTKTKEKIMTSIIDPLLADLTTRYYPYFISMTIILILIILLLAIILILLVLARVQKTE